MTTEDLNVFSNQDHNNTIFIEVVNFFDNNKYPNPLLNFFDDLDHSYLNIDCKYTFNRVTALICTAEESYPDIVKKLLSLGAMLKSRRISNWLHFFVLFIRAMMEYSKYLPLWLQVGTLILSGLVCGGQLGGSGKNTIGLIKFKLFGDARGNWWRRHWRKLNK